jgi:hypothetical protein
MIRDCLWSDPMVMAYYYDIIVITTY